MFRMNFRSPPLATLFTAALIAVGGSMSAVAQGFAPEIQITGENGEQRIVVGGQTFNLFASRIDLVGRWKDYVLVAAQSGGSACPVSHYWLDLSRSTPVLSDFFGDCYEVVDVVIGDDGSLIARASGVTNPKAFTYRGGTAIEAQQEYSFETDESKSRPPLDFANSRIGDLFGDAHWGPLLMELLGEAEFNAVRGYYSGPGGEFIKEGAWWVANGCGRGACNEILIAVAVNPDTDKVLLALVNPYADDKLKLIGQPKTPIPPSFARVLGEAAEYEALRRGFNRLSSSDRRAVQARMKEKGFYTSNIDGQFGKGTAAALVRMATATAHDYGELPDMESRRGAEELIKRLTQQVYAPLTADDGSFPFEGIWDCGMGTVIEMTARTYKLGQQPELVISEVVSLSDTALGVTFTDGYRLAFFDLTDSTMLWHSPASGDSFDCRKTGEVELTATTPADAAERMAEPSETKPIAPPTTGDAQVEASDAAVDVLYLFQGEWTCTETGAEKPLTKITLTDDEVEIAFMGTRIAYANVTPVGRNGTAFNIELKDGQMGGLYELSDQHFLLNFSGLSLFCER